VDAFNMEGRPPADRSAAGMTAAPADTQGSYVSEVDIIDGRVQVTFNNDAHQNIQNDTISFTPYMSQSGSVMWRCGAAGAPAGAVELSGGGVSSAHQAPTVETRYLPSSCRN
ncbi:MAG: pilin, partial [Proteobacteria bacterium]|nr:pilin [Pseudomonadota bacterium]